MIRTYVHMYVQDTKCTQGRAVKCLYTYIHTYVCNVFTVYFQGLSHLTSPRMVFTVCSYEFVFPLRLTPRRGSL